jgi:hypothetical protein
MEGWAPARNAHKGITAEVRAQRCQRAQGRTDCEKGSFAERMSDVRRERLDAVSHGADRSLVLLQRALSRDLLVVEVVDGGVGDAHGTGTRPQRGALRAICEASVVGVGVHCGAMRALHESLRSGGEQQRGRGSHWHQTQLEETLARHWHGWQFGESNDTS